MRWVRLRSLEKPGEASTSGAEARAKDVGGEVRRRAEAGGVGVYKPGEACGFYSSLDGDTGGV